MRFTDGSSLLSFVETPIVVGDPDGRVVHVNPAYEREFGRSADRVRGEQLAALFGGGARESMLNGVAGVCQSGQTARFRIREGGIGYLAMVSPIANDGEGLGVIILLTEEPLSDERLITFHREMQEPLEELQGCLDELLEETGGRRNERHRRSVEAGLGALERARKWSGELHRLLTGRATSAVEAAALDPVQLVRQVVDRLRGEAGAKGAGLDTLVPARLPTVSGEASQLEAALVQLVRQRLEEAGEDAVITLSARAVGESEGARVIVSVVDGCVPSEEDGAEPRLVAEAVQNASGRLHRAVHPGVGRVVSLELPVATTAEPA